MIDSTLFQLNFGPIFAMDEKHLRAMSAGTYAAFGGDSPRARRRDFQRHEKTAVISLMGILLPRATGLFSLFDGFTGLDEVSRAISAAVNDDYVERILLHVDSPGGSIFGVQELAEKVLDVRQEKPVVAVIEGYGTDAAYWIASAATEVIASPSSIVGGVGIAVAHTDMSRQHQKTGIKYTIYRAGKHKAKPNPYEPMDDIGRAILQKRVDGYAEAFIRTVATGRQVTPSKVKGDFGQGRTFLTGEARAAGLIDRVATVQDTLGESLASSKAKQRAQQRKRSSGRSVAELRLELLRRKHNLN